MSIAGSVFRFQCRWLPHTRPFDRFIALQGFIYAHHRLPSGKSLLNDVIYAEKTSKCLSDPLYAYTSDKEYVKDYIAAKVGRKYTVETIDVIRCNKGVSTFSFPQECCIKPTHLSGYVTFKRSREKVDVNTIRSWFRLNHYLVSRERQYKTLKPKIIIEPIIQNPEYLRDYKIFCDHGVPTVIQVDVDRHNDHRRRYYSASFKELPFTTVYPRAAENVDKPAELEEMIYVARTLSAPFRFCRIDFYVTDSIYVGEITHHHESAHAKFIPAEDEFIWSKCFFVDGGD